MVVLLSLTLIPLLRSIPAYQHFSDPYLIFIPYPRSFQVALPSARRSCNQHRGDQEIYTCAKASHGR